MHVHKAAGEVCLLYVLVRETVGIGAPEKVVLGLQAGHGKVGSHGVGNLRHAAFRITGCCLERRIGRKGKEGEPVVFGRRPIFLRRYVFPLGRIPVKLAFVQDYAEVCIICFPVLEILGPGI